MNITMMPPMNLHLTFMKHKDGSDSKVVIAVFSDEDYEALSKNEEHQEIITNMIQSASFYIEGVPIVMLGKTAYEEMGTA